MRVLNKAKSMAQKVMRFVHGNIRQIAELLVIVVIALVPWFFDLSAVFKTYLESNSISPDNFFWYIAFTCNNLVASLVLVVIALVFIRGKNSDFMMNSGYIYHDYSYAWYWVCSKVLGIRKCSLVLVPIYMQFKLAFRGTFPEYPLDDEAYPTLDNESPCSVTYYNRDKRGDELNLILEDTYTIKRSQLPHNNQRLFTIKISRNTGNAERHFSQRYIDTIIDTVIKCGRIRRINVYATTNPKNTLHIARRAFGSGSRGNINHLYVFQQSSNGERLFFEKGHKIF